MISHYMIIILFLLLALRFGDIFVLKLKKYLHNELEPELSEKIESFRLSRTIGYLERALVYILAIQGHPEVIGWILQQNQLHDSKNWKIVNSLNIISLEH